MSSGKEKNSIAVVRTVAKLFDGLEEGPRAVIENSLISGYVNPGFVLKTLKTHIEGPLPSIPEIHAFLESRKKELDEDQDRRIQVQLIINRKLDLTVSDFMNPTEYNYARLNFINHQIMDIKRVCEENGNPDWYASIAGFIKLGTEIQMAQIKIEDHEVMEVNKLRTIAGKVMRLVIGSVADYYKKEHGDKNFLKFSKVLGEALDGFEYQALEIEIKRVLMDIKKDKEVLDEEQI